jgi:plasmid stabilization system protein ParE
VSVELRVLDDVADRDLPGIIAYHLPRSRAKAVAILSEYDQVIDLLELSPHTCRPRGHGWRIYTFRAGTYALYYREMEGFWLVAGVFHSRRDPD